MSSVEDEPDEAHELGQAAPQPPPPPYPPWQDPPPTFYLPAPAYEPGEALPQPPQPPYPPQTTECESEEEAMEEEPLKNRLAMVWNRGPWIGMMGERAPGPIFENICNGSVKTGRWVMGYRFTPLGIVPNVGNHLPLWETRIGGSWIRSWISRGS